MQRTVVFGEFDFRQVYADVRRFQRFLVLRTEKRKERKAIEYARGVAVRRAAMLTSAFPGCGVDGSGRSTTSV